MVIILIGVAGAGKTTIGKLLAEELGWPFYEGDHFHPQTNIEKMKKGLDLTDEDREPWLDNLQKLINGLIHRGQPGIVACSALKRAYREYLQRDNEGARFIYLKGDYDLIRKRLEERKGHCDEAESLFHQVVEIYTAALGLEHPNTKTARDNYDRFLKEQSGGE